MSEETIDKVSRFVILFLIAFTVWLLFFSCKTAKPTTFASSLDSIYTERLVSVTLPSDSSAVKALLRCSADGIVTLVNLEMQKSKNAQLTFLLDSLGNLKIQTIFRHDTIFVPVTDTKVYGLITKWEYTEKPLTKWQKFKQELGGWAFGGLCAIITAAILYFISKEAHWIPH